jgi:tRNA threonylcarbamoyladenosine modification (KEOPS) complex Cgi121 subunit
MVDNLITIEKISENINEKEVIRFDGKCVYQVVYFLPPREVVQQACEIINYIIRENRVTRIKSLPILFLLLLTNKRNINDAIEASKNGNERYLIKCCISNQMEKISVSEKRVRYLLSLNAINSIDWLS